MGLSSGGFVSLPVDSLSRLLKEEELENGLRHVLRAMYEGATGGSMHFPYPLQYGYDIVLRSRHTANNVAMRARNAFLPLMAQISLMFFILNHTYTDSWREKVIESSRVHPQWFADLESSVVGNMKIPRVGGIIDLTDPESDPHHKLHWLLPLILEKLPLPLYLHWGRITIRPALPIPPPLKDRGFYPNPEEIAYLNQLPGKIAFSTWHVGTNGRFHTDRIRYQYIPSTVAPNVHDLSAPDSGVDAPFAPDSDAPSAPDSDAPSAPDSDAPSAPNAVAPSALDSLSFPQPEKNSGQRYGEDVHAFFARRKARNEQLAKMETSKMKQERLQREANAAQGAPPVKKGARVFIWEAEDNGFFIRRAMNRAMAADSWHEFTSNQCLYDGYHDEDGGTENHVADCEFPEFPGIPDVPYPQETAGNPSTTADLNRSYGLERDDVEDGELLDEPSYDPYHDMSQIPFGRFGFVEPTTLASYNQRLDAKLSLRSLGDEQWSGLERARHAQLPSFLALLEKAKTIGEIPRELLDLRQEEAEISFESNWVIAVRQERLNGNVFYVLEPKLSPPQDFPLYILIPSAVTTLQVVRMGWGPDLQEVIYHLLQHGVEFRVCIRHSVGIEPIIPIPDRFTGLGYRRKGYKPTSADHGVYVEQREDFLRSPRGRAALFAGGIIGRLAQLIVDESLASMGPSREVLTTGVRLWDGCSSAAYWDDNLTDQDIDLICGVYEIATAIRKFLLRQNVQAEELYARDNDDDDGFQAERGNEKERGKAVPREKAEVRTAKGRV
ncbi:hypothetical protein B0H15DRAFT_961708 [Mycena belliarum]|uniref:Uncharacterized protein n=1 Tax=Mycena belliarum TaxID=1033014 RepID=A0AAD6TTS0_9AGAR|nr:hypothetical protein B0H15DRAFT_961708 [Mycena belliae]